MPVNVKRKGSDFEREATKLLEEKLDGGKFRRIPSSGAIGTNMSEPLLTGDISGIVDGFPKTFKFEAKVGYGGSKQFTLKKEWIDKIIQEAGNTFSYPAVIGKFSGARSGVTTFVVLDIDNFAYLVNQITELQRLLNERH
jgi:Holliday junction resolvase